MYPLDRGTWGPIARITHLRDELARRVELDVIAAERGPRRGDLLRYAFTGRLRRLDAIYVENSSTLPSEIDLLFLALARVLGIRVVTYVRDAQYLFEEYYAATSVKRRLARALFPPAIRLLRHISSVTGYPSIGLARAVGDRSPAPLLLPPGSPDPIDVPRRPEAHSLLFVGGMRHPVHGLDLLIGAVELVRRQGHEVDVICFSRPGEEPPEPRPSWLHVERGGLPEIQSSLPEVVATIQPRHRSPYNDLAVPIKVMEYLSYGRPMIVTDCVEQARVVREAECGIVVSDAIDALAAGIGRIVSASSDELDLWSTNATSAARRESWSRRADRIVESLTGTPS
jgi:hypothetical protein